MPKKNLEEHFAAGRREWTERKHALLARYVVPGAMKIKETSPSKRVALIDGYAGPNEYAGDVAGSTVTMVEAARKVIAAGGQAQVYAFEPDGSRYDRLCRNLESAIRDGILNRS